MVTEGDVAIPPLLSVAFAVTECDPAGMLFHGTLYGADVSTPIEVAPVKNSTCVTVPFASLAVAVRVRLDPAGKIVLVCGDVTVTVGEAFGTVTEIPAAVDAVA